MLILGINTGMTRQGKILKDGGLCVIEDGKIVVAAAEERFSRIKHSGGYEHVLNQTLLRLGITLDDFDAIVLSSCCEVVPQDPFLTYNGKKYRKNVFFMPSHHLSHAFSTYFVSPFDEAIVVVMDAGGNLLVNPNHQASSNWWLNPREQNSYYIAKGENISLIDRDFDQPLEAGFGEAYRAFTHYLGWHSYTYSANTMALAAYGDPTRFNGLKLFEFDGHNIHTYMSNNPLDPINMVKQWASQQGVTLPDHRLPDEEITKDHMDIARYIQDELERALIKKITYLAEKTNIKNLCVAGGVGLNCVANRRVLDFTPIENIFIQPASGDDGQALGNALYGYVKIKGQKLHRSRYFSPYLGYEYNLTSFDISITSKNIRKYVVSNVSKHVALALSQGKIVGWYQGRSEFGPRALGNRSILADPRYPAVRERCHLLKKREFFRPFSPSVLEDKATDFFDLGNSPYMLLVSNVLPQKADLIPAVLHIDNTARLQTVAKKHNPRYYDLIKEFEKITQIPLLLNTSFNQRGAPIVETPQDAVDAFLDMDIDILTVGDMIIEKFQSAEIVLSSIRQTYDYPLSNLTPLELERLIKEDFPDIRISKRSILGLYSEYLHLLEQGKKRTTIRYVSGALDIPHSFRLPLHDTGVNGKHFQAHPAGKVLISRIVIKKFGSLDDTDARNDGFDTKSELIAALTNIYGAIQADELVSIYFIELLSNGSKF